MTKTQHLIASTMTADDDYRVFCPICGWEGKRLEGLLYQCKREHRWIQHGGSK